MTHSFRGPWAYSILILDVSVLRCAGISRRRRLGDSPVAAPRTKEPSPWSSARDHTWGGRRTRPTQGGEAAGLTSAYPDCESMDGAAGLKNAAAGVLGDAPAAAPLFHEAEVQGRWVGSRGCIRRCSRRLHLGGLSSPHYSRWRNGAFTVCLP